jgi:hypothetical protein
MEINILKNWKKMFLLVVTRMFIYGDRSEPQNITELAEEMSDVVPRLSYQAGGGSFPEPCVCIHVTPILFLNQYFKNHKIVFSKRLYQ